MKGFVRQMRSQERPWQKDPYLSRQHTRPGCQCQGQKLLSPPRSQSGKTGGPVDGVQLHTPCWKLGWDSQRIWSHRGMSTEGFPTLTDLDSSKGEEIQVRRLMYHPVHRPDRRDVGPDWGTELSPMAPEARGEPESQLRSGLLSQASGQTGAPPSDTGNPGR